MITPDQITNLADQYGLVVRGGFGVVETDLVPDIKERVAAKSLVLFGNAGSSLWRNFSSSAEFADGQLDPLNRWSERIGNAMAKQLSGRALFPFGGPPYQPFISWAKKAESLQSSKMGMLIHPQYGLWHAYRFAIALPVPLPVELKSAAQVPDDICAKCVDQPCLKTCPVDAFSGTEYDVDSCFDFIDENPQSSCRQHTCQARLACPEGHEFHYEPDHAKFHMNAFYHAIVNRRKI